MREVYLDYAAATPIDPHVKDFIKDLLDEYGNPNALHKRGERIESIIEDAKKSVAQAVNCGPKEVYFFNSASEANEVFHMMYPHAKIHSTSHDSMFNFINTSSEPLSYSYEWVNNETGNVYPQIEESDYNLLSKMSTVHIDASQALGKFPIDLQRVVYWDYVTLSSPKIYGPPGAAALIIKDSAMYDSYFRKRHLPTPNWLSIAGFGKACDLISESLSDISRQHDLQKLFMDHLEKGIPDLEYNSAINGSVFNILNVYLPGIEGEALVMRCSTRGVYFSTGSACAAKDIKPSHVLMSMFENAERAHGSIRLSYGLYTTEDDVKYACDIIIDEYNKLKKMSTINYGGK